MISPIERMITGTTTKRYTMSKFITSYRSAHIIDMKNMIVNRMSLKMIKLSS